MADDAVTVTGLNEVLAMLTDLPREIVARAWLKALRAGANVMSEYLSSMTPEADEGSRSGQAQANDLPHLVDSIVVGLELDSGYRGGIAFVGFGKMGHVALWIEYGHWIVGHKPSKKVLGWYQPHPFMVPVIEAAYEQTLAAFAAALVETLTGVVPGYAETFLEAGGELGLQDLMDSVVATRNVGGEESDA